MLDNDFRERYFTVLFKFNGELHVVMVTIEIMKKVNSCVLVANKVEVSTYLNQTVGQSLLFNTHFS